MPYDLSAPLVIGISATALFDLSAAQKIFEDLKATPNIAIEEYRKHMLKNEDTPLKKGTGYNLVESLLNLNKYIEPGTSPLVEVVIMSRNSPDTGVWVLKNIREHNLNISRSAFTAGEPVTDYLEAFKVDLFLTTNEEDAQKVIDSKVCAAAFLYPPPPDIDPPPTNQVRIAFDGDAVLFNEDSEFVYKTQGIEAFHAKEDADKDIPLPEGPHALLLIKLSQLQEKLPMKTEFSPVRIAIVTARNAPSDLRVIYTLRSWKIYVDEAFFLGGVDKSSVLKAFRPHIFFDDQDAHLISASKYVPSGKVPYPSDSQLTKTPNSTPAKKPKTTKNKTSSS